MTARARGQWILLALLVVSVTINYIDRGNLSIAASRLSSELSLDPEKIGLLLSSFFWTYAAMQIVAGLADRSLLRLLDFRGRILHLVGRDGAHRARRRIRDASSRCGFCWASVNRSRIRRIRRSSRKDLPNGIADSPTA